MFHYENVYEIQQIFKIDVNIPILTSTVISRFHINLNQKLTTTQSNDFSKF